MRNNYLLLLVLPLIAVLISCQPPNPNEAKYKAAFIEVNKIMDSGDLDQLDAYIKTDVIDHQLDPSITKTGLDGVKEMFNIYQRVFPDMHTTIHTMAVSGDTLFALATSTGTSTEPYMGMPANQKMSFSYVDIVRFEEGKMAEHWGFVDMAEMMGMMQTNQPMEVTEQ